MEQNPRWRRYSNLAGLSVVAAFALVIADACTGPAGEVMKAVGEALDGGALEDAGRILRDAGEALVDGAAGGKDAAAQGEPGSQSGSRIEMRYKVLRGADGSRLSWYAQPYDSQREEDCGAMLAADGRLRCIPNTLWMPVSGYYADASCESEVAVVAAATCAAVVPKYVYVQTYDCERFSYALFARGAEHAGKVYLKSGAGCEENVRTEGLRYFLVGAEIPASSFVEFTETFERAE